MCGWGVTNPPALSTRQMVEADRRVLVPLAQVGGDGRRPGVEPSRLELLAQGDDLFFPAVGDPGR